MGETILLAGYYGHGNAGDDAILTTIIQQLRVRKEDLSFAVLTSQEDDDAWRRLNVTTVNAYSSRAVLDAMGRASLFIIGGGGLFQDYWGSSEGEDMEHQWGIGRYYRWALWAKLAGVPIMTYAVGVGPLEDATSQESTRRLYHLADVNTVRDRVSLETLQSINVPVARVRVTADPAVHFRGDLEQAEAFLRVLPGNRPWMTVVPRSWIDLSATQQNIASVAQALDRFLHLWPHRVLFLPFQSKGKEAQLDLEVIEKIREAMVYKETYVLPLNLSSPEMLAGLIAHSEMVVTARLHGAIFAASHGVPFVALAYDPKVSAFAMELGQPTLAIPFNAAADVLYDKLRHVWNERESICQANQQAMKALQAREAENAHLALALLEREASVARQSEGKILHRGIWGQLVQLYAYREQAQKDLQRLIEENGRFMEETQRLSEENARLKAFYYEVQGSRAWRLVQWLWKIRRRVFLPNSIRTRVARRLYRLARAVRHPRRAIRTVVQRLLKPRGVFAERYHWNDNTIVTLYTDKEDFWPDYSPRKSLSQISLPDHLKVSLVMPILNEEATLRGTLQALTAQTRLPDELIIVDTGSTDNTLEMLHAFAEHAPFPVKILERPGSNIAQARNIAIAVAHYDIIAATDFGCYPTSTWLENLLKPFADQEDLQVAGGVYRPIDEQGRPALTSPLWPWTHPEWLFPAAFLPPGGSIAFRREAWEAVGGFPEWVSLTGEDTLFDVHLKEYGGAWAFVPDAVVSWIAPASLKGYLYKMYRWSTGDGESGVHADTYWWLLLESLGNTILFFAGLAALLFAVVWPAPWVWKAVLTAGGLGAWGLMGWWFKQYRLPWRFFFYHWLGGWAKVMGFLKGTRSRALAQARRWERIRGVVVSLSPVPLDDTGGGSRFAQLALAFARSDFRVFYLNRYPKYESVDLHLRIGHANLSTSEVARFSWQQAVTASANLPQDGVKILLLEFPHPDFVPFLRAAREHHFTIVYDVVDAWDTALGGDWYQPQVEQEIIASSDIIVATAQPLAEHVYRLSGREAVLIPNAVNRTIFDPTRPYSRPEDMPQADWIALYIGALWGNWFDWALIQNLALAHPSAAVVLIGDYKGQCPIPLPNNVYFLGLKPQRVLPAYLAHADVAIVPWKISDITKATSPLKVYEYLAMHKPVVAPAIPPLEGIPGVWRYSAPPEFLPSVEMALKEQFPTQVVEAFVQQHTWEQRVQTLLKALQ